MSRTLSVIVSALAAALTVSPCLADRLPEGATKVPSKELRAIYSGKSSNWSKSHAYFAPDGSIYMHGKDKKWFAEGKWNVSGNKVCANFKIYPVGKADAPKPWQDCWTYYRHGKKLWSLWSGSKDKTNDWYDGELSKLSKGDKVTKTVASLKAQTQAKAGN